MNTKIIAHRGYSHLYPENTMLAFKEAEQAGAHGIELDVHLTKDQQIVICHDEEIDRTSNGQGYIKDLTLGEIQEFQFLNGMNQYQDQPLSDITAPALDDFLDWFSQTDLFVNIEIKNNIFRYDGIVSKIIELIAKYDIQDRVIISSFNHHTLMEVKQMNSEIQVGFLTACSLLEPGSYCAKYGVGFYHPLFISLDPEDFENCSQEGIGLNVWTVNEEDHINMMLEAEVAGIITNDVELAMKLVTVD